MLADAFLTEAVQASHYVYDFSDEFLKAFCEHWCPSTNTFIIPPGKLSISLWDFLDLGGLSVTGRLFDEVVPTGECLSQSLSEEARLPASCMFLLLGYHYLAVQSPDRRVLASAWISFWNHSIRSYVGHEAADRSTSKSICPRKLSVLEHRSWDAGDRHPFDTVGASAGLEEEVYCPAFLSCWLCVFVLPAEPLGFIRAGVFKMASFMANGYRVSLAPPFLSCIYKSLSQISLSNTPSIAPECFPAPYLIGWMGTYLHA
ncbi:hypothetical protein LIER_07673 [Lithospermum erythrorhizon]|uniref:Aminotransferase-like plant mobile domain-containing protein n=1 Tax=Lithospermum erythrorhizon TaxID=34254 RepID=A0AAV3PDN5_LITER